MNISDVNRVKSHLQYGGDFQKEHWSTDDELSYLLFSQLDHPRIPMQPFDLVMLLDFIHREFALEGVELMSESGWIKQLIKIETIWLKPYYKKLMGLFMSDRKQPIYLLNNA